MTEDVDQWSAQDELVFEKQIACVLRERSRELLNSLGLDTALPPEIESQEFEDLCAYYGFKMAIGVDGICGGSESEHQIAERQKVIDDYDARFPSFAGRWEEFADDMRRTYIDTETGIIFTKGC